MKTYIVIISYILLIYPWSALSQKEDYVWVSGHVYRNDGLGNLKIDFNAQPPILSSIPYAFTFSSTNNCISDANGALQLMTNGIQIKDAQGRILEGGGAKLIPDSNYYVDDQSFTGLNFVNGTLLLPLPETKETYALFHYNLRESANPDLLVEFDTLYMSTIKKNNQGRYYISEFRKKVLLASIDFYLTSVRHANGKDWWIVALGRLTNRLYVMRLGKDGAEFSHSQDMGLTIGNVCGAQTKFTPDGKKFIWFACCSGIHIKDFDRRTGKFCNPVYIPRWDFNESFHSGVECSPSSQYVYVNTEVSVWQLDITAKDIAASKIKLAQIDRFASDSSFAYEQLAPNNKIYISGSRNHLHVIDKPNLKGTACDLRQNSIKFNIPWRSGLPNFPNFRLGPMDVDVRPGRDYCISLTTNPVVDRTEILTDFDYGVVQIFDVAGKLIQEYGANVSTLDIGHFPSGMYILTLLGADKKTMVSTKLVKL